MALRDPRDSTLPISTETCRLLALLVTSDRWARMMALLKLSPRERQIVDCIVTGVESESLIASRLGMPKRTVHAHVERMYLKLQLTNRTHLVLRLLAEYTAA